MVPPHMEKTSISPGLPVDSNIYLPAGSEHLTSGVKPLPASSKALPASSDVFQAGSKALPAGSEAHPAGYKALLAGSEVLPAGSQVLPAGFKPLLTPVTYLLQQRLKNKIKTWLNIEISGKIYHPIPLQLKCLG